MAPTTGDASNRRYEKPLLFGLLGSTVVGLTGLMAVFLRQSGFLSTDFLSFQTAQQEGLSLGYLVQPVFDHFVPGHRFVNWFLQSVAPLNFRASNAILLACFAATVFIMHRVLVELFRFGRAPLLLTLFFGASAIQVATALWWAAGLSRLPAALFGLLGVLFHLRYRRMGRGGLLALSVAAVGVATMFSEDAALLVVFLVALRVLLLHPEESLSDSLRGTAAEWKVWLPYLIPVGVSFLGSSTQAQTLYDLDASGGVVAYVGAAWFQAFVPVVFGQLVNDGPLSGGEIGVVVATQIALLGVFAFTVVERSNAWRAWLFFAIGFLATQAPVGLVRTGFLAPEDVAHQHRYYSVTIVFFTVALGAAFIPVRGPEGQEQGERSDSSPGRLPRAVTGAALSLVLIAYLGSSVWAASRIADGFHDRRAGPYLETLKASLHALRQPAGEFSVLDAEVPDGVIEPFFAPLNRLATIVPLIDSEIRISTTAENLYRATSDGHVEPIRFTPQQGGLVPDLVTQQRLGVFDQAELSLDEGQLCVESGERQAVIAYQPDKAVPSNDLYLRVRYRSEDTTFAHVLVERDGTVSEAPEEALPIVPWRTEAVSALGQNGVTRVVLLLQPEVRLCLAELVIARVERLPGTTR